MALHNSVCANGTRQNIVCAHGTTIISTLGHWPRVAGGGYLALQLSRVNLLLQQEVLLVLLHGDRSRKRGGPRGQGRQHRDRANRQSRTRQQLEQRFRCLWLRKGPLRLPERQNRSEQGLAGCSLHHRAPCGCCRN